MGHEVRALVKKQKIIPHHTQNSMLAKCNPSQV